MKVFGFAGYSGSGKTTLIERLVPRFVLDGLKVSLIKHAHAGFDIDRPGKDSYRHREAGCTEVLLTSTKRWVLMHELRGEPEPTLEQQLAVLSPKYAVLDETDSGLDVDALKMVAEGVNALQSEGTGLLLITHHTRILDYLKPDRVLVMKDGHIVREGGPELAREIEEKGFGEI